MFQGWLQRVGWGSPPGRQAQDPGVCALCCVAGYTPAAQGNRVRGSRQEPGGRRLRDPSVAETRTPSCFSLCLHLHLQHRVPSEGRYSPRAPCGQVAPAETSCLGAGSPLWAHSGRGWAPSCESHSQSGKVVGLFSSSAPPHLEEFTVWGTCDLSTQSMREACFLRHVKDTKRVSA